MQMFNGHKIGLGRDSEDIDGEARQKLETES